MAVELQFSLDCLRFFHRIIGHLITFKFIRARRQRLIKLTCDVERLDKILIFANHHVSSQSLIIELGYHVAVGLVPLWRLIDVKWNSALPSISVTNTARITDEKWIVLRRFKSWQLSSLLNFWLFPFSNITDAIVKILFLFFILLVHWVTLASRVIVDWWLLLLFTLL